MRRALTGVRGTVAFTVLAVSAVLFSSVGAVGFVALADRGRQDIRERITEVLDQLEDDLRAGGGVVTRSTADGVQASVVEADAEPRASGSDIVVQRPVTVNGRDAVLVGRSSQAGLTRSLRSLYRAMWLAVPLASIASAVMAGLATGRALRPVAAITELAASIGSRPDGERVPVPASGDEIERLAHTVNRMLDRIDAGAAEQARFTSDAAHELRTPLMALQGEVELLAGRAEPPVVGRLTAQLDRLASRIDDLVLLSVLDEGRPTAGTAFDVREVVAEEAAGVSVTGPSVMVAGDRALVARAIRNLLANAALHGTVVSAAIEVADGHVVVHVDDDGPGIPVERRDEVFRRFARIDEARSPGHGGSGLGLAIVAAVASAHGGSAHVGASPLGGARVSLRLPAV